MKSNKEYRFKDNPKEEKFHDEFKKRFDTIDQDELSAIALRGNLTLSAIVFGWENDRQQYPKRTLTPDEEDICLNLIQWLGSPVGQGFLDDCGFVPKQNTKP